MNIVSPSSRRRAFGALLAALAVAGILALRSTVNSADEAKPAAKLEIKPGDHICIIGNTLADRMQHDGWLETHAP